jgi:hypothetical protein
MTASCFHSTPVGREKKPRMAGREKGRAAARRRHFQLRLSEGVRRAQFAKARMRARKCAQKPRPSIAAAVFGHHNGDYELDRIAEKNICSRGGNQGLDGGRNDAHSPLIRTLSAD